MVTDKLLAEIERGEGEPLTRAGRRIPSSRKGRPSTLSRLLRWVLNGTVGPDGQRVYLEAVRGPSGWLTTPGAICRYLTSMTPRTGEASSAQAPRSPDERHRAAERAAKELDSVGI